MDLQNEKTLTSSNIRLFCSTSKQGKGKQHVTFSFISTSTPGECGHCVVDIIMGDINFDDLQWSPSPPQRLDEEGEEGKNSSIQQECPPIIARTSYISTSLLRLPSNEEKKKFSRLLLISVSFHFPYFDRQQ